MRVVRFGQESAHEVLREADGVRNRAIGEIDIFLASRAQRWTPPERAILKRYDIAIVGAGIAGASLAAALAPHASVLLIEGEDAAGYHATGRSARLLVGKLWRPRRPAAHQRLRPGVGGGRLPGAAGVAPYRPRGRRGSDRCVPRRVRRQRRARTGRSGDRHPRPSRRLDARRDGGEQRLYRRCRAPCRLHRPGAPGGSRNDPERAASRRPARRRAVAARHRCGRLCRGRSSSMPPVPGPTAWPASRVPGRSESSPIAAP